MLIFLRLVLVIFALPLAGILLSGHFLAASSESPSRDVWEMIRATSLAAMVVPVPLLILTPLASEKCKSDRRLLLRVFSPGLKLCGITVALSVLLQGVLVIIVLWNVGLVRGFLFWKLFVPAVAATAVGVHAICRSSLRPVQPVTADVAGFAVTDDQEPALWKLARAVAKDVGSEPPDSIVLGVDPQFFVTEAATATLNGICQGRTLFISVPLCRLISPEELRAILAHEFSHFSGEDTVYSQRFYPIYRGATQSLEALLQASPDNFWRHLLHKPGLYMLSFFLHFFSRAESTISREREFRADRCAAGLTGPETFASALLKVVVLSRIWESMDVFVLQHVVRRAGIEVGGQTLDPLEVYVELGPFFEANAPVHASSVDVDSLCADVLPHPTDSHPPLGARVASLGVALRSVRERVLNLAPADSAKNMFADIDSVEQAIHFLSAKMILPEENVPSGASAQCICPVCNRGVEPTTEGQCPDCGVQLREG